jgi:uncharacterized protein (TIGR03067 family)
MSIALSFLVASLTTAADPKPAPKAELEKLQGTWEMVAAETRGKTLDEDARKQFERGTPLLKRIVIKKSALQLCLDNERPDDWLPFEIDFSTQPRMVRWSLFKSSEPEFYAIYTLDGDTLKVAICLKNAQSKEQTPKDFKTKEGDGNYIYVFKRAKADPK